MVSAEKRSTAPFPELNHVGSQLWIFPGQGDVQVGIGKHEYETSEDARRVIHTIDEAMADEFGFLDFSKVCFSGDQSEIIKSENAHVALLLAGVAKFAKGVEDGTLLDKTSIIVGASAGAIPALVVAGSLSLRDGVILARERGRLTQEASNGRNVGMATVIRRDSSIDLADEVKRACEEETSLFRELGIQDRFIVLSGIYSPIADGISGDLEMIEGVKERLKGKALVKNNKGITIASHSPYMEMVGEGIKQVIKERGIKFYDPGIALVMNAKWTTRGSEIADNLADEVTDVVKFDESVQMALDAGVGEEVEFAGATDGVERWARFGRDVAGEFLQNGEARKLIVRVL